ncbi:hypothetical protein FQA39_LY11726 [Lamprigera yunnana]|nr:hypothetical protein FQA39_LY11726 [Lamprigera yunnana]
MARSCVSRLKAATRVQRKTEIGIRNTVGIGNWVQGNYKRLPVRDSDMESEGVMADLVAEAEDGVALFVKVTISEEYQILIMQKSDTTLLRIIEMCNERDSLTTTVCSTTVLESKLHSKNIKFYVTVCGSPSKLNIEQLKSSTPTASIVADSSAKTTIISSTFIAAE